jgi:hypothetical protein
MYLLGGGSRSLKPDAFLTLPKLPTYNNRGQSFNFDLGYISNKK